MRRYLRSVLVTLGVTAAAAVGITVNNAVAHCPVPDCSEQGGTLVTFNCGTDICGNGDSDLLCGFCVSG